MEELFYVGQKVVAINSHHQGYFKEGDIFEVLSIKQICCKMCIQINPKKKGKETLICQCGKEIKSKIIYFAQECFAPVQEIGEMTFEEACELVNKKEKTQML